MGSTQESTELLKLLKCSIDTGTDVISKCVNSKLLQNGNCTLVQYLEREMHNIYHQLDTKKVPCCECPQVGCAIKKSCGMETWMFKRMYDDTGKSVNSHLIIFNNKISQICLHRYKPRLVKLEELDIGELAFLLRNSNILSTHELSALNTIVSQRNLICHVPNTTNVSISDLNSMWLDFERAVLDLAFPADKKMYTTIIKLSRKVDLERQEAEEIKNKLTDISKELHGVKESFKCSTESLENCFVNGVEKRVLDGLRNGVTEIKHSCMQTTECFRNEIKESNNEMLGVIMEKFGQIEATIKLQLQTRQTFTSKNDSRDKRGIDVECQTEADNIDEDSAVNSLPGISNESWEIISAKKKCVLLQVKMNTAAFTDKETLRKAIRSLVEEIIRSGNVDTSIPVRMTVKMAIQSSLLKDEIKVVLNMTSGTDDESKDKDMHGYEKNEGQKDVLLDKTSESYKESETFGLESLFKEIQEDGNVDRLQIKGRIYELFQRVESEIEIEFRRQSNSFTNGNNQPRFEERSMRYDIRIKSNFQTEETHVLFLSVPYTVPDGDMIQLHSANTNSILLEATSSPSIFKTKETLRAAIRSVIKRILDAGKVNLNMEANVNVNLIIITALTDDEAQVVIEMIGKSVNEVQTAGPKILYQKEQEDIDSTNTARNMSSDDFMTKRCSKCNELEKSIQKNFEYMMNQIATLTEQKVTIKLLEEKISKLIARKDKIETVPGYMKKECSNCTELEKVVTRQEATLGEQINTIRLLEGKYPERKRQLENEQEQNKGFDVDTFGVKQSNPSTGIYESFKSKGEPYVINAISVFVIDEIEVDWIESIDVRDYIEKKLLHERLNYSEIDSGTQRAKTNTEIEITTDFDNIAKLFAEFQGFKGYKKLSRMDRDIERFTEFDMDCTVLLIQKTHMLDLHRYVIPFFRSKPTVVIMQVEEEEFSEDMLFGVLRKPDVLLAMFPSQNIGQVTRFLGAAMDKMKSGDDFASVLLAVSKEVEYVAKMTSRPHRLPSVVISTLTKDLSFQKKDTNLPKA